MAMLPIFVLGIVMGVMITVVYFNYKKETPSEVQIHVKDAEIIQLKEDIKSLEKCIQKKDDAIERLKQDIQSFEARK